MGGGRGVGGEEKSGGRIPVGRGEWEEGFGNGGRKWVEEVLGRAEECVCVWGGDVCVCVWGGGGDGGEGLRKRNWG